VVSASGKTGTRSRPRQLGADVSKRKWPDAGLCGSGKLVPVSSRTFLNEELVNGHAEFLPWFNVGVQSVGPKKNQLLSERSYRDANDESRTGKCN
jgi:hypothetical protein